MRKLLTFFSGVFAFIICTGQPNNYYYYYKGQTKSITLSEKVMVAKFIPGTSTAIKEQIITSAQVDLLNGTMSDIPDIVKLQSKILQRQVWVYPCGIPEELAKKLSKKEKETAIVQLTPPCEGCPPPDCTPYQVWQNYDNFYEALFYLLDNSNILSASKSLVLATNKYAGTVEDFYIKIKQGFTISDFNSLLTTYSLTYSNASNDFGAASL